MAIHVDDCHCIGTVRAFDKFEKLMQVKQSMLNHFRLLWQMEQVTILAGCEVIFIKEKKKVWLGQPHIIMNLKKKLGEPVMNLQS